MTYTEIRDLDAKIAANAEANRLALLTEPPVIRARREALAGCINPWSEGVRKP